MKTILTILTTLLGAVCFAQPNGSTSKIGPYQWINAVIMEAVNSDGTSVANPKVFILSREGQRFRVVNTLSDGVLIQVIDYTGGVDPSDRAKNFSATPNFYTYNFSGTPAQYGALSAAEVNSRNYGGFQKFFKVTVDILDAHAIKNAIEGGSMAFGIINFPFKVRTQSEKFDFSGAVNFGAALGFKFPSRLKRKFKWTALTGYSISSVKLDPISVKQNGEELAKTNDFTAFSFSIGPMVEFDRVQAGLFMGFDILGRINQSQYIWDYQKKPWFSIGFGYAIFSRQDEKAGNGKASQ